MKRVSYEVQRWAFFTGIVSLPVMMILGVDPLMIVLLEVYEFGLGIVAAIFHQNTEVG